MGGFSICPSLYRLLMLLAVWFSSSVPVHGLQIEFTEPQGGIVHAFVKIEQDGKILKNRDHLVVSVDVHESITIGASVGIRFRGERGNYFDHESGVSITASRL